MHTYKQGNDDIIKLHIIKRSLGSLIYGMVGYGLNSNRK